LRRSLVITPSLVTRQRLVEWTTTAQALVNSVGQQPCIAKSVTDALTCDRVLDGARVANQRPSRAIWFAEKVEQVATSWVHVKPRD